MNSILVILAFVIAVIGARENTIIIESDKRPSGTIFSKGFPYSYNPIDVETFDFRGHPDEKVQITFDKFHLYPQSTTNERCGIEGSFITYKKTEKSADWEKFCGDHKPLPIMSEDEHFILRYEGIAVPANSPPRVNFEEIGFNASFRFVKNYGIEYNMPQNEYLCDFTYDSENFPNGTGTFNSPNFPGMFPGYILCYYTFRGQENNILFNFAQFNLLGSNDCNSDDKKDKLQFLTTTDGVGQSTDKIEYCGSYEKPFSVTISNRTAFIIFYHQTNYSDYELAKHSFVGFNATFMFTNDTIPNTSDRKLPDIISLYTCMYLMLIHRSFF